MILLTAPWVLPMCGPPFERGAVLVSGSRIAGVGPESELRRVASDARAVALEDAVLLPGLVNAHAHLELTGFRSVSGSPSFTGWIKEVIRLKRSVAAETFAAYAELGSREALAFGQTVVADVVSNRHSAGAARAKGQRVFNLAEVIAPDDANAAQAVEAALELMETPNATPGGLFPHTPFTVGGSGYETAARESLTLCSRWFTHLAESPDEVEFCLTGRGPLIDELYAGLPVAPPKPPLMHPFDWLDSLGLVGPGSVLVHGVQMSVAQVARMAELGAPVVLCPRSNRALGVGKAPGRAYLRAGATVALGTDSVLSGGDLDLLKDAAAAVEDYGFSPAEALYAATLGGARALGVADAVGALKSGLRADILALRLGAGADVCERALNHRGVLALWSGGERVADV